MRHMKLEKGADGIAVLILDHADQSMNVMTPDWIVELEAAIADVKADAAITGLVITSGKKAFMAGADLKSLVEGYETLTRRQGYELSQRTNRLFRVMETMGKPVAAALNGLALGGGFEFALACHYRVLADDPKAVVGLPEVTVGLLPGGGGTQRLPRLIGAQSALELLLTGRSLKPAEALQRKLVDAVVPADQVVDAAKAWLATKPDATRIWDRKSFSMPEARGLVIPEVAQLYSMATAMVADKAGYNYPAPPAILSCVFEGLQLPIDRALSVEGKYFALLLTSAVARNIIRTGFVSKQAAEKGARRPAGVEKKPVKKVGVLGAGMMGAGIALVSAQAGIDVVLIDRDIPAAEKGKAYSVKVLGRDVEKGRLTREAADAILARITPADGYAGLADADLIVEAVFEDIGIKGDVTKKAEAVIPATAVFGSNTSTLPISKLAKASVRPERFIGIHFFSPVERMGLVEIIMGKQTGPEALACALDYVAQIRKTPIVVNDSRGFYTSRVFQMLVNEGATMLGEGVKPALVENAAKSAGFPIGPLALLDELTLDLPLKIVEQAIAQEGEKYLPPSGIPVMRQMVALGRTSRKAGGAFYNYAEDGSKHLWPGLAEAFPAAAEQPPLAELETRYLYAQAMETARCFEEGVLETPQDADLGAVFGWGFPVWAGGTLSYIDTVGVAEFVRVADRLAQAYGPRFAPSPWLRERAAKGERFYPKAG